MQFLSLIYFERYKKVYYCILKKCLGLEGQGGCKVAANILHGFDCTNENNWKK